MKKKLQYYTALIQDDVRIGIVDFFKKVSIYTTPEKIHNLLILLIILSIVRVGITAYFYDPQFAYDESNTLNIAKTSVRDIWEILANEHNFTGYYYLLYGFHQVGDVELLARIFNFLTWVVSVWVFCHMLELYLKKETHILYGTLLYTLLSMLSYYAYFIRMYGLINLLFLLYIYSIIKLFLTHQKRWMIMVGINLLLLGVLHPVSAIVAGMHMLLSLFMSESTSVKVQNIALGMMGMGIVLVQLLLKNAIGSTFLGEKADYVYRSANLFISFPARQLFLSGGVLSIGVYGIVIAAVYILHKKIGWSQFSIKIIGSYSVLFILFSLVISQAIPRHIIIFTPILLLVMLVGLFGYKWKLLQRRIAASVLFVIFIIQNIAFTEGVETFMHLGRSFCYSLSQIEIDAVILDYTTYNAYQHCLSEGGLSLSHAYITDPINGLVPIEPMIPTEVLYYQSVRGGSYDITTNRSSALYVLGVVQNNESEVDSFHDAISSLSERTVAYIAPFEQKVFTYVLYPSEAFAFQHYVFKKFLAPNIFIFTRE